MKKVISMLLVAVMCCGMLVGCGEKETVMNDFDSKTNQKCSIKECTFEIPENWEKTEKAEDMHYYYPKDGMLMVQYIETDSRIMDEDFRKEFLSGFIESMETHEFISESEIEVDGEKAYQQKMNVKTGGQNLSATMVAVDCRDGFIVFMLGIEKKSNKDYSKDFERVINSIVLPKTAEVDFNEDTNYMVQLKEVQFMLPDKWKDVGVEKNESEKMIKNFSSDDIFLKVIHGGTDIDSETVEAYMIGVGTRFSGFEMSDVRELKFGDNRAKSTEISFTKNEKEYMGMMCVFDFATFIFGNQKEDSADHGVDIEKVLESIVIDTSYVEESEEPKNEETAENNSTEQEKPINFSTISKSEFDQIQEGMSYEQVVEIIGGKGELLSEGGEKGTEYYTVIYSWDGEGELGANANCTFQGGKLALKAQYGLK